jgi:hypothetical protein
MLSRLTSVEAKSTAARGLDATAAAGAHELSLDDVSTGCRSRARFYEVSLPDNRAAFATLHEVLSSPRACWRLWRRS